MKKMFYALALIVSSFFLFFSNVNADIDITFDSSYLNDLDSLKALASRYHYSPDYIITRENNYYYMYFISSTTSISYTCNYNWLLISPATTKYYVGSYNGSFTSLVNYGSASQLTIHNNSNNIIFYSTLDIPTTTTATFNFALDTFSTSFVCDGSPLPTESDIYNLSLSSSNSHDSELSIIQNFYEVSISKISYLAESISSNYIYLSIFGVFILIFVFELIFRRYL